MPDALRTPLATQLEATVARRSHGESLYGVPSAVRGVQPDGLSEGDSLWQILEHMRIRQADYHRFCTDPDYTAPTWPDDCWPASVAPPSEVAWNHSFNQFRRDLQSIKTLVNDSSVDITDDIPHTEKLKEQREAASYHGATYAEEIAVIADHNAYHLGQFVTVQRLLSVGRPRSWSRPYGRRDAGVKRER